MNSVEINSNLIKEFIFINLNYLKVIFIIHHFQNFPFFFNHNRENHTFKYIIIFLPYSPLY